MTPVFNNKQITKRILTLQPLAALAPLQFISGSICDSKGNVIASMNREHGTTPLSPSERDDFAMEIITLFNDCFAYASDKY